MLDQKHEEIQKNKNNQNSKDENNKDAPSEKIQVNNSQNHENDLKISNNKNKSPSKRDSAKKEKMIETEEKISTKRKCRKRSHKDEDSIQNLNLGSNTDKINRFWDIKIRSNMFKFSAIAQTDYIKHWIKKYAEWNNHRLIPSNNLLEMSNSNKELNIRVLLDKDIEDLYKTIKKIVMKNKL